MRRLTHRVADLERAAMTIPVGVTVNVVNPGGPLHDDSETESTDHDSVTRPLYTRRPPEIRLRCT